MKLNALFSRQIKLEPQTQVHWKTGVILLFIAVLVGTASSNVYSQLPLEKEKNATPSEIASRAQRNGGGWILHSDDRENLSFAITNWNNLVVTNLHSYRVSPRGLSVRSGKDEKDIFLNWEEMPWQTTQKYQQVVAEAQREIPIPQPPAVAPVSTPPSTPAYSPPEPVVNYTPLPTSSGGGKTVHVRGYTRKDGTYVAPHTRSAPRRK